MKPHLLVRKKTHFVLWRPGNIKPVPKLKIGILQPGNPPTLGDVQIFPLKRSKKYQDLWRLDARTIGLVDGQVYHYWFSIRDSFAEDKREEIIDITDPFATTVDWRLLSDELPEPYSYLDRDPASVIMFRDNHLVVCDPGGEIPVWKNEPAATALPPNNKMVIYEMPANWTRNISGASIESAVGTFQDVQALIESDQTGANFEGLSALNKGKSHLKDLGINALELLPPADSFVKREWGYATSNYLAPDFDLGFPDGNESPTATTDLTSLVNSCHKAGIRFIMDVVMAFATNATYQNLNYIDFHVLRGTNDPEEGTREDFGGKLMRYNFHTEGYDPISGEVKTIVPARQWMKTFLAHWMYKYRLDGVRMDSVVNFNNWDFIKEFKDLAREIWRERWLKSNNTLQQAEERFLVIAEELAVPIDLVKQSRVDSLWNEGFQQKIRDLILGGRGLDERQFKDLVMDTIDCRRLGFTDCTQAVNYITSHDVEGMSKERLYDFLHNNGVALKEKQIKLAFALLLTAVGIPMILAGEEFADQHDLVVKHPEKQRDPVNYSRMEEDWRRDIYNYVSRLVHLRTGTDALCVNDTGFLHFDTTPGRRIFAYKRGMQDTRETVVVVANCSSWGTEAPESEEAEYKINNWPSISEDFEWFEVTQQRKVPSSWAGREPIFPWEAKIYITQPR